jgi:predicted DNA-binding transcriptional regulator AlpA
MSQRLYRLRQLASTKQNSGLLPCSPATIWRMVNSGEFPQPFKIGQNCTVWDASEVELYIKQQQRERGAA